MIKYEWRSDLTPEETLELSELLDRAGRHDAEAEHNSIDFASVRAAMAAGTDSIRHLLIWMLPHAVAIGRPDEPERIAGVIRLEFIGKQGEAEVTAVVHPDYRAIGILTLFLEQAGADPDPGGGWLGSGAHSLSAWARGNHPAAGRISKRFLIPPSRRVWKLLRPIGPGDMREFDEDVDGGLVRLSSTPASSEEFGPYLTIHEFDPGTATRARTELLDVAAMAAAKAGVGAVAINVDSADRELVQACRLSGFRHERADVCYQIGNAG